MEQIKIENLSYIYPNQSDKFKKALDNINLNIQKGEFVGIIGHTGSGKSTLVKHLNGLLKPSSGNILLDGRDIWSDAKNIKKLRFKVGLVFQYPEHQLFEETVFKDIAFGPTNKGFTQDEIKKKVLKAANFVEISKNLLDKSPFELSGGEQRKVAIAGIISMEPDVLVLDEPTAGLDPKSQQQLLNNIKKYNKVCNKTVILISHDINNIAKYADKVLVLDKGKILLFDDTRAVFNQEKELKRVGLNVPQITSIMSQLKKYFPRLNSNVLTVNEAVQELVKLKSSLTKL